MATKKAIIEKVYYETFGPIKDVLKDAKALDSSIKEKDVKEWKDGAVQRKINLAGTNSFVASKPREEYQMDLFEMPISRKQHMGHWGKEPKAMAKKMAKLRGLGEEYATGTTTNKSRAMKGVAIVPITTKGLMKFGLLLVDIFTKFVTVVPIDDNTTDNVLKGLKVAIVEMGGETRDDLLGRRGSASKCGWDEILQRHRHQANHNTHSRMGCRKTHPHSEGHAIQKTDEQRYESRHLANTRPRNSDPVQH